MSSRRCYVHDRGFTLIRWCSNGVLFLATAASAAGYPEKPIRFIVGFPPGGAGDLIGRFTGQMLSEELGQPVVIDNRSGAGGIIGADIVAKALPDGYTLLLATTGAITVSPSLQPRLPYNPLTDFTPVGMIGNFQNVVVVPTPSPYRSLKELVAAAQRDPGKLNYASTGLGATPHLAGEMLKVLANAQLVHVPYKGNGPAMTDLLAGRIDSMFPTLPSSLPYIKAGRLRALAVTGDRRSNLLPDVPTVAEQGWPGYRVVNWFGILGPAKMPPAILEKLHRTLVEGLEKPQISERLGSQGVTPESSTPHELAGFMKEEIARWAKLVKSAKITAE
jgi:tripartite-type tricarboxylate transporter receptor subunit TctC